MGNVLVVPVGSCSGSWTTTRHQDELCEQSKPVLPKLDARRVPGSYKNAETYGSTLIPSHRHDICAQEEVRDEQLGSSPTSATHFTWRLDVPPQWQLLQYGFCTFSVAATRLYTLLSIRLGSSATIHPQYGPVILLSSIATRLYYGLSTIPRLQT